MASTVVLVEGVSDKIAVETLARAVGRDLGAEGVAVVPTGGAHAIGHFVARFGRGAAARVIALCDAGEQRAVRRAASRADPPVALFVCVVDLEDELIRAVTPDRVRELLDEHGDLRSFRTFQKQPAWRGEPVSAQLRRYLAAGSTRKLRYARRLVVAAVQMDRVPPPLRGVLAAATTRSLGGR